MKRGTKLIALAMALTMLAAVTGCSNEDVSWAAKLGDETLPGGVYATYLMMGYQDADNKLTGTYDNLLREKIDGQPVQDYIVEYAKDQAGRMLAMRQKYHELNLTMDESERSYAMSYAAYLYTSNADYYRVNKVTQEDVQYIYEANLMNLAIFDHTYGKGGEKEVPAAELQKNFEENYTRSQFLVWNKRDATTGAALPEEELTKLHTEAEGYLARALTEGQSFTDLIHELDLSRLEEGAEPFEKSKEDEYDAFLKNGGGYYPAAYEEYVQGAAVNSIDLLEDDDYIYVIKKLPIGEASQEKTDYYLTEVLRDLKYAEFLEDMEDWGKTADVVYNSAALKAYTPKKLKMTYEQVQAALLDEKASSPASDSSSADGSGDSGADSQSPADSDGSSASS